METLLESGFPDGAVNMVMGDAETAWHMILDPRIAAVSLTGSQAAGQQASALCGEAGKPLQAELGGNNAAVVLPDCDLDRFAPAMALAAFGFAGQRCTATRRFIVIERRRRAFEEALAASAEGLRLGPPEKETTQLGPLISMQSRARVQDAVDAAIAGGTRPAVLICHSLSCSLAAHWAARKNKGRVAAAFVVAPADVESDDRTPASTRSFAPIPRAPFPVPTLVVASTNDPYVTFDRARGFAESWGADFCSAGELGRAVAERLAGEPAR